jgi:elongation factor P hydroxylase
MTDGDGGIGAATQHTDENIARVLYQAFLDNYSHLMRNTAEEPMTYPHPAERDRELLRFAKDYVETDLHPIFDEAIAIPDGPIITDTVGNPVTL